MTASTDEIDIESSPLAKLFAEFGTIISLTARQKPGLNRSWAFITFATAVSVEQALKPGHAVKHGSVQLQVEKTNVEEQLQRAETGALAQVWQRQQAKEMEWMQSLLHGMHKDASYTAAKARVGASMGLRAEELGAWGHASFSAATLWSLPPMTVLLIRVFFPRPALRTPVP